MLGLVTGYEDEHYCVLPKICAFEFWFTYVVTFWVKPLKLPPAETANILLLGQVLDSGSLEGWRLQEPDDPLRGDLGHESGTRWIRGNPSLCQGQRRCLPHGDFLATFIYYTLPYKLTSLTTM